MSDATGPPSARDRILDAAETSLLRYGIRRTTMAGVADLAGVSRAWLYRHFPDKPTLLSAALIRRDAAFWRQAQAAVDAADGFAAKVTAAVMMSRAAPLGPLATDLRDREPEAFASVIGNYVEEIVPGLAWFWREQLTRAVESGEVRTDLDVPAAAEWVIRIVVSLVGVPGETVDLDDPASVRSTLEAFLMPALT